MKFMDIATQSGSVSYFQDMYGYVVLDKFIKWWFTDYEKIIEDIIKAQEEEKKNLLKI
jgi:hypothetical protein